MKKDKCVIRIKHPQLRRLRTALRTVIDLRINDKLNELHEITLKIIKDFKKGVLTEEEYYKKFRPLQSEQNRLRQKRKKSIVICGKCFDVEKDHIYVAITDTWYCEKCCKELSEYFHRLETGFYDRVN